MLIAMLTSCASMQSQPTILWQFSGKLSVSSQGETDLASIEWQETDGSSQIQLSGPMGLGTVDIELDNNQMSLSTSDGDLVIPAGSPVTWDDRSLELPWQSMSHWVRGNDVTGRPIPPEGLQQGLWVVRILKKDALGPRLMTFEHPDVSIRLSVSKWGFGAVSGSPDPI